MSERVRLTISIQPEVLEVFRQMAAVSGLSVGRTIGDWCGDTVEGAQMISKKMAEAREAPARVMREFHQMALGIVDEVRVVQDQVRVAQAKGKKAGRTQGQPQAGVSRRAK